MNLHPLFHGTKSQLLALYSRKILGMHVFDLPRDVSHATVLDGLTTWTLASTDHTCHTWLYMDYNIAKFPISIAISISTVSQTGAVDGEILLT